MQEDIDLGNYLAKSVAKYKVIDRDDFIKSFMETFLRKFYENTDMVASVEINDIKLLIETKKL